MRLTPVSSSTNIIRSSFQSTTFRLSAPPKGLQPRSNPASLKYKSKTLYRPFSAKMAPVDFKSTSLTPIVISGPSGSGKSTILTRLFAEYPSRFGFSVSHTTRAPRGTEQNGKEYYFVSREEFQKLIADGGFVEHAQFGGNYYGTSVRAVEEIREQGRTCVLDIEMEGVKQVSNHPTFPRPKFLFLSPPSMEILEQRLRSRATDKEEAILKRLQQAKVEMEFARSAEAPHDKIVVNDDLETAYQEVRRFCVGDAEPEKLQVD